MKYKWILFDADGTLFDYDTAERVALTKTLANYGCAPASEVLESYRSINSRMFRMLESGQITPQRLRTRRFEMLFDEFEYDLDPAEVSPHYLENLSRESTLLPGAIKTVKALHQKCRMMIITNGLSEVQRPRLTGAELNPYIDDILISDEVGSAKPAVEIFDIAFQKMGMPVKAETMIVGDSLTSDMAGGVNYGIDTCWYNPGELKNGHGIEVTYEIRQLEQLVDLVNTSDP
ncbi:MAG: noncanonical pyrimidine nucleotidase, YjjG family [Desulfobacteraceae bacterium]|nr:noncanonical pyrimidine nucleotidase, YjjG family [Desulfobacteraceae bacterium]